jgi:hypothetical protein
MFTLNDFSIGTRVEMHPCTDLWMRGAMYGTVYKVGRKHLTIHVGRKHLTIHVDRIGRTVRVAPENIGKIVE